MFGYRGGRKLPATAWNEADSSGQFWVPAADVYQLESGWVVKVELAGVRREDVRVTVEGNSLRIRGQRRDWLVTQTHRCESLEISYHRFERRFEFPADLEGCRLGTEFRDGMLLVTILTGETTR